MRGRPLSGRPLSGRPLSGRPLRGWGRSSFHRSGGGPAAFSPLSLDPFIWLDPSDLSTMFQDSGMTTPVTTDGDPVGAILDKSGNGFHLTQATAGSRPLYRTAGGLRWLEGDGVDDFLSRVVAAVDQPCERLSAWRRLTAVADDRFVFNGGGSINGQLFVDAGNTELEIYSGTEDVVKVAAPVAGADFVATARYDGLSSRLAVDNAAYVTGDAGSGSWSGITIFADAGGNGASNSRFYGLTQFDRLLTDPEIAQLRTYLAGKQGRVL